MTSNHHAPYDLGLTRTTMAVNRGMQSREVERTPKSSLSSDCKLLSLGTIMTVPNKKAPANYVPAAAVKRRVQALSGITGCKGSAGGPASWK